MVRRLKDLIGRIIFFCGMHRAILQNRALVVAFHSVNDEDKQNSYNCSLESFQAYCRFFSRHFDVVDLDELLVSLDRGKLAGKAAITFDDGYRDNQTNALPVLKAHSLPATIYVISNEMERAESMTHRSRLSGDVEWLDWKTLKILIDEGMTIGCHTKSHQNLGNVSIDVARSELSDCRAAVSRNTGSDASHFAYPYGGPYNLNADVKREVMASGFQSCTTCYGGLVDMQSDRFELPREPVSTWYYSPYHFGFEIVMRRLRNVRGLPDQETRNWGL